MSMKVTVNPVQLAGTIASIASKSVAHRLILLAALTNARTEIDCTTTSQDIEATIACAEALGARIVRTRLGFRIVGIPHDIWGERPRPTRLLDCGESGTTLRFMLPIVAALGCGGSLVGHGRLKDRPLSPLYEQLVEHGAVLSPQGSFPLEVSGQLRGGTFVLPGNVSSQFVSGLLMAAPLIYDPVRIFVKEPVESAPYITMTVRALAAFGVRVTQSHETIDDHSYLLLGIPHVKLTSPQAIPVEGDWSNAAFWLAAGAVSERGVEVTGLDSMSTQGDRAILPSLALFGTRVSRTRGSAATYRENLHSIELDVSNIPDLVPPLAAVAAQAEGTTCLHNVSRLRYKESDRLKSICSAIQALGGNAYVQGDDLFIEGASLVGGTVDAANDHRIAMMAAVMACGASGPVTILGADCVSKSYPSFWEDYALLGGDIECVRTE